MDHAVRHHLFVTSTSVTGMVRMSDPRTERQQLLAAVQAGMKSNDQTENLRSLQPMLQATLCPRIE